MFTGIVEEIGTIASLSQIGENQFELNVMCNLIQGDMKLGDSVAVNGVCLTVVKFDASKVAFEISSETIAHTNFSQQKPIRFVNLERALKASDRLGGHIVQGHVDCLASIIEQKKLGSFFEIDFSLPAAIRQYVVKKGSITIDGISLTIAEMSNDWFRVAIIPHTFQQTILSRKKPGDSVHIETDIIARYIERLLVHGKLEKQETPGITQEFLKNYGF